MGRINGSLYYGLSTVLCALYNPYVRCVACRDQVPPGSVMLPFSLGVTVILHFSTSVILPRKRALFSMIFQTLLCLVLQNCFSFFWSALDEQLLLYMANHYNTEEDILKYWRGALILIGSIPFLIAVVLTKCSKGHIYFDDSLELKPWTCYWKRISARQVHFQQEASIIPDNKDL